MGNVCRGLVLVSLLAGCAPKVAPGDADAGVDAMPQEPEGPHHNFVIDSITLPNNSTEAQDLGLDLDQDGDVDNQLGGIISLLSSNGADINEEVRIAVDEGSIIHLADLQATALADARNAALYIWVGDNASPAPCVDTLDTVCRHHLDGTGTFDVVADMPEDAMIFGEIDGTRFLGGSGVIQLEVPLFVADATLTMQLIGARAAVSVSESALTDGHLAGAVRSEYIESDLIPQLHVILTIVVEQDCGGTSPSCCTPGTNGEQAVEIFDTDMSCTVSLQEIRDSSLLDLLLAPDVDLLDEEGLPGEDGVLDSVSLGVGFTAVQASYEVPAGL